MSMEDARSERRRPGLQAATAILVVLVTLALVAGLVWFRLAARPSAHAAGQLLGTLTVAPGVDFACHLPVTAYSTAAMVSLPDGAVVADPTVARPPNGAKGLGVVSYDAQLGRWVPVQRSWVSPDGRQYAFGTTTTGVPGAVPTGDLRVHDIASGKDRTLWQGEGMAQVMGWSGSLIVFTRQEFQAMAGPSAPEVWGVDAAGGTAHRIGPNPAPAPGSGPYYGGISLVGGGAAWSIMPRPGATLPAPEGANLKAYLGPGIVSRIDLRDGTVTPWYTAPTGSTVSLLGLDASGHPIVTLFQIPNAGQPAPGYRPPAPRVLLLTGRDQAQPINPGGDPAAVLGGVSGDSHGIWFSTPGQIWLYRNGSLRKVADVPAGIFPVPTPPPGYEKPPIRGPQPATAAALAPAANQVYLQIAGACA